jgi:adenosyl cobinamide kinase/adenosyl cobinamide phosphate guanylyltransferase
MAHLTLLTGGAASGKSTHAVRLASDFGPRVLFIATCEARDDEMRAKVARHRAERPDSWTTIETQRNVAASLGAGFDGAVIDCLTLLVSQLLVEDSDMGGRADSDIFAEVDELCRAAKRADYPVVIVTNEVGLGLVPDTPLGRRFREVAGRANRIAAELADRVEFLVCGIPWSIKNAG